MFFIAYANKPGEALFSFSNVGDAVKIGRDKRICNICLGANAQGVSRVHMRIELKQCGSKLMLFSEDVSTYGTGYNGGPLEIENRERELHPDDTLQIGNFYLIIGRFPSKQKFTNDELAMKPTKERIPCEMTLNGKISGNTERSAIKRPPINEDTRMIKRSKNDGLRDVANGSKDRYRTETKMPLNNEAFSDAVTLRARSSLLEDVDAEMQTMTQPRILVNDTGATQSSINTQRENCSEGSNSWKPFLPSEDDECDMESEPEERAADRSNVLAEDSSDEGASHQKRCVADDDVLTTVADSMIGSDESDNEANDGDLYIVNKRSHLKKQYLNNDGLHGTRGNTTLDESIIAGAANRSRIADLQTQFLMNPLFYSTQRDPQRKNFTQQQDGENSSNANNRRTSKVEGYGRTMEREGIASIAEERQAPKRRGRPPKSKENVSERDKCGSGRRLMSARNATKKSSTSSAVLDTNEQRNITEEICPKRIKLEPIDTDEEIDNSADKGNDTMRVSDSHGEDDGDIMRNVKMGQHEETDMGQEEQNDNLILGLDIETIRRKLAKIVEYCDLEKHKPTHTQIADQSSTTSNGTPNIPTCSAATVRNFKRFKKAPQGCYSQEVSSRQQPITQIIGITDMVDFRNL